MASADEYPGENIALTCPWFVHALFTGGQGGYSAYTANRRAISFDNAMSTARPYDPLTSSDQTQSISAKRTITLFWVFYGELVEADTEWYIVKALSSFMFASWEGQCSELVSKGIKDPEASEQLEVIFLFEIKTKLPFSLWNYRQKLAGKLTLQIQRNVGIFWLLFTILNT